MQKNAFSYLLGVVALSLLCSCGTGKKEEVKVDVKDQTTEATKEVALADQPQAEQAEATTENAVESSEANTTVAQVTPSEVPVESNEADAAAEENKVA